MCITKENPPKRRSGGNSSIRSYDPVKRHLQSLAYELHIFETIIKLVNTALHDRIGEIFCLEALFEASEDNQFLDPLFSFKAT